VVLVLANGFFVATEFAIVAVRRSRLEQLVREGRANAAAARQVVDHLDAYIAACQLGITMASLALGWIGEPALSHLIEPVLVPLVGQFAPTAAHGVAVGTAVAVITALHIVIGELAPKGLALQRAEGTTLWVARPMQLFYTIFRLPITLLNMVGNGVLRLIGLQPAAGHEMVHSVEELRLLVTSSQAAGLVEESEARIASRAFRFADVTAAELMTPRNKMDAVPATATLDELLALAARGAHSRVVVYQDSRDNVLGVLHLRELFKALAQPRDAFNLREWVRPVLTVPETKRADDVLEEMQQQRRQLAVVVDEYGGTAGVVTLDDLLGALVGRIDDELAPAPPRADSPPTDGTAVVLDGRLRLEEFEEQCDLRLPPSDHALVNTLGGLVMERLDRVPRLGDTVTVAGRTLEVARLDGRRVAAVRVHPASSPAGAPSPATPPSASSV
jgi:putative hemolysin